MTQTSGFQVANQAPRFYDSHVERFMAPFVQKLVSRAVTPRSVVLDVACGTGFATRAAAIAAGPSGRVTGSDINPAMLEMAQSVTGDSFGIQWVPASAMDLPFENHSFDAVISQQGLQFFPNPVAGLREMARVTKAGGTLAATVWAPKVEVPYLDSVFSMCTSQCNGSESAVTQTFAEGGEAQIRNWFEQAGLAAADIELIEANVSLPPVGEYVEDHIRALPPMIVGEFLECSAEVQSSLLEQVKRDLSPYADGEGYEVPFRSYLAMATV
ncbi:methyltransferase [Sedimentitalea sp. CY04]|uniref:Methyltransferase n=1 Tax=Parasedimentitalea denitrificans TaxID=2211118 RepID=A0ABX0WDR3_9RHOB|nr:class I SAM-dependent methyltransferase [Sedimentitalea sp. CY04]NIZ62817.1 methyltransferase [Sedimentitalea sp. CY04]